MRDAQRQAHELPAGSIPAAIWETTGVTEHMGGLQATQSLLDLCEVGQGQAIIDIGCGTGGTVCYLARAHRARVTAVDLSAPRVADTRRRAAAQGLSASVAIVLADAQELPCGSPSRTAPASARAPPREAATRRRLVRMPGGPRAFLANRVPRLGIPLLFFTLTMIPLQLFVFTPPAGQSRSAWPINVGHMWFVEHLLIYMSLVKTARQSEPVMGLTVALTGILAGLIPTGDPSQPGPFATVGLFLPQGWAMRGFRLAVNGATPAEIWPPLLVLLAAGPVLFAVGVVGFRRRFA